MGHVETPVGKQRNSPYIVGIGGTIRADSTSEKALRMTLSYAELGGAEVRIFGGAAIEFPIYVAGDPSRSLAASELIRELRRADGIILASPGYHGSISGLLKNCLDYTEEMRNDVLPYFEGRAVGVIACAAGWQATGSTLSALRSIVHALRGWPTPYGAAINTIGNPFNTGGGPADQSVTAQLQMLANQVVEFAHMRALYRPELERIDGLTDAQT
jgi:FMN reductase